jgi:hypothetical protein
MLTEKLSELRRAVTCTDSQPALRSRLYTTPIDASTISNTSDGRCIVIKHMILSKSPNLMQPTSVQPCLPHAIPLQCSLPIIGSWAQRRCGAA